MSGGSRRRHWLVWIVAACLLLYILGSPEQAAGSGRELVAMLESAARGGAAFLQALARGAG